MKSIIPVKEPKEKKNPGKRPMKKPYRQRNSQQEEVYP